MGTCRSVPSSADAGTVESRSSVWAGLTSGSIARVGLGFESKRLSCACRDQEVCAVMMVWRSLVSDDVPSATGAVAAHPAYLAGQAGWTAQHAQASSWFKSEAQASIYCPICPSSNIWEEERSRLGEGDKERTSRRDNRLRCSSRAQTRLRYKDQRHGILVYNTAAENE